jgi:hypothetical protein
VSIIIAAGICSVSTLAYFSRLRADVKRLEERLQKRSIEFSEDVQVGEEWLIEPDYAAWTSPLFWKAELAGGGYTVPFYSLDIEQSGADEESGQIPEPAIKKARVPSSRTPSPANGRRQASRRKPAGR